MNLQDLFKKKTLSDYIIYVSILLGGIIIDQFTKWLAVKYLIPVGSVPLIKFGDVQVLNLTYVENTGAAFGMLKNAPWVFNTVSVVAIIVMLGYLFLGHAQTKLTGISLAMLVSGGIGNMIDRATLHYVVDFIDFRLINFAVFNGADAFVCVGAGMLVLALILEMKEEAKKLAEQKASTGSEGEK
jgi:signal peptidase II